MIIPKRHQLLNKELSINEELSLAPWWQILNNSAFQSTLPSPPKEAQQNKIIQIMRDTTKPPTPIKPIKPRTRSQSETKEPPTLKEQTETSDEQTNKKQPKTTPKTLTNKDKQKQKSSTKGRKSKIETTETSN